jgi:predicted component of type VI protein secretion system
MRGGIAVAIETYETGVAFSLLDRLINTEQEIHSSSWAQMRAFKASVCRDLTALLNTRRAEEAFDPIYSEAANSLLSFGTTDFRPTISRAAPNRSRCGDRWNERSSILSRA